MLHRVWAFSAQCLPVPAFLLSCVHGGRAADPAIYIESLTLLRYFALDLLFAPDPSPLSFL